MEKQNTTSSAWYEKTWVVVLLCIFFFPVGLYALWKNSTISKGWKIGVTVIIVLILIANIEDKKEITSPTVETSKLEIELKNFTKEDVARFAISSIMRQPSKEIKVRLENELYYVSYKRKSDLQKFNYKIKISGDTIVWASIDGRWRNGQYDERISFKESDNKLKITQIYTDGSVDTKEYNKGE